MRVEEERMKESWMDKLIELLNEYRTEKGERNLNESEVSQTLDSSNYLRSFIKWLVDNDKIYLWDIALTVYNLDLSIGKHTYTEYPIYESLLMLLAIQDNPIEFLVSILR
jgi:hypothetical protein